MPETGEDRKNNLAKQEKSSGRSWSEEEKELVKLKVDEARNEGLTLTQAFKRISALLPQRSEAAVAMLYYNVIRRSSTAKVLKMRPRRAQVDNRLMQAFEGLPEFMRDFQRRVDEIEKQAGTSPELDIASFAGLLVRTGSCLERAKTVEEDLARARDDNERLASEIRRLHATVSSFAEVVGEMRKAHNEMSNLYAMFANQAGISQIVSLADFKERIRHTLDAWADGLKRAQGISVEPLQGPARGPRYA